MRENSASDKLLVTNSECKNAGYQAETRQERVAFRVKVSSVTRFDIYHVYVVICQVLATFAMTMSLDMPNDASFRVKARFTIKAHPIDLITSHTLTKRRPFTKRHALNNEKSHFTHFILSVLPFTQPKHAIFGAGSTSRNLQCHVGNIRWWRECHRVRWE